MPIPEPTPQTVPQVWQRYFLATRPGFLAASVVPVLLGLATAHADGADLVWLPALLALFGAILAQAAFNVLNDYYDSCLGADEANRTRLHPYTGGSRFIQNRIFTLRQTRAYGWGLMAAVAVLGVALVGLTGIELLWTGLVGVLLGWLYTAPPIKLAYRGLGELAVFAGFGLCIPLGADFVLRGDYAELPVLAGLSYGLLVAAMLFITQFPDYRGDAAMGKRNWVVRLGPGRARWLYLALIGAAYAWVLALVFTQRLPVGALAALFPAGLSMMAAMDLLEFAEKPVKLERAIRLTIKAALVHGVILALALV